MSWFGMYLEFYLTMVWGNVVIRSPRRIVSLEPYSFKETKYKVSFNHGGLIELHTGTVQPPSWLEKTLYFVGTMLSYMTIYG